MKGTLVIISAPGGGGKNSVIAELLKRVPNATRFVTTTTRPLRPGERDGVDYHFISRSQFEEKIVAGDFIEHTENNDMAGNLYGSDRRYLDEALRTYDVVFAALDVRGKKKLTEAGIPHQSIFIFPDSLGTLAERIRRRGGVTEEQVNGRVELAKKEIAAAPSYDHRIVNHEGKMEETVLGVLHILQKEGVIDKTKGV